MPNLPGSFRVRRARRARGRIGMAMLLFCLIGCSRTAYRQRADQQVYDIMRERAIDWRWQLPERPVEAHPQSRMADPFNPDREPIPPDDPAARLYQVTNGLPWEFHGWKKRGTAPVEDLSWKKYLPTDSDGAVRLGQNTAMQIFSINSRDYQFALENVYLQALALTFARFQFAVKGFANQTTYFQHFGGRTNGNNQLQLGTNDGFNLQLMTGAQVGIQFLNSLAFEYTGKGPIHLVTSNLLVNFSQPLFRGAFARIVTQPLSVVERNTLYTIRAFANQRRVYYVNVMGSSGYLGLLGQLQQIRNQEALIEQFERNLEEYDAMVRAGLIDRLQRDLIAQSVQTSQFTLVQLQAGLQTALDAYKFELGLPTDTFVRLDDSPLKLFELNDPRFEALRKRNDELYLELLQYDVAPPNDVMADATRKLLADFGELEKIGARVEEELRRWKGQIPAEPPVGAAASGNLLLDALGDEGVTGGKGRDAGEISRNEVRATLERQRELEASQEKTVADARLHMADNIAAARDLLQSLDRKQPVDAMKILSNLVGREFRGRLSELFVAETQIRVFLIEFPPVDLTLEQAISIALENRLDLKNSLAQVTDTWRTEEFDANLLRGFLNLNYQGNLNKAPNHGGILGFDTSNSTQRVGVEFDAPINRRAERNQYRTQQITYQRARRAYMQLHDLILEQVRLDMRQLALARRQFEIGREQLIIASRQVEQAEYNLRNSPAGGATGGQSASLYLQQVLGQLLGAKNSLIGTWVNYLTARMTLYQHFDTMNINGQGVWTNEYDRPTDNRGIVPPFGQPLPPPPPTPGPFAPP